MPTPEIIRQIADSRRKEREGIEQKKLLKQRTPQEIAQENAKKQVEQIQVQEMFRNMRIDCEDLLNKHGKTKKRGLLRIKYKFYETFIPDEQRERVKICLLSSRVDPASSDIRFVAGEVLGGIITHTESKYVKFERDHAYTVRLVPKAIPRFGIIMEEHKREPNLQDAKQWKEVVDALKNQNQTSQSSPIEHK